LCRGTRSLGGYLCPTRPARADRAPLHFRSPPSTGPLSFQTAIASVRSGSAWSRVARGLWRIVGQLGSLGYVAALGPWVATYVPRDRKSVVEGHYTSDPHHRRGSSRSKRPSPPCETARPGRV